MVVSNIWEISYSSLSTGALVYAAIIIPTIMLSRLTILSILTHFTPVPERKKFISTGIIPLPSQIFLAVWLRNHGEFLKILLQYKRTKDLREKIQTENNEVKKQKFIEKENQILSGKDSFSQVISFVKWSIDYFKIPFKN